MVGYTVYENEQKDITKNLDQFPCYLNFAGISKMFSQWNSGQSRTQNESENHRALDLVNLEYQPNHDKLLECLLIGMFDLHFYVDHKMRLLTDSVKLRHFLSLPIGLRAEGRPLESYVPNENDKSRLKRLIARAGEFQSQGDSVPTPPVVRISMLLEGSPTDVDILVLPDFVQFPGDSSMIPRRFLFCIKMASRVEILRQPTTTVIKTGFNLPKSTGNTEPHSRNIDVQKLGRLNELYVAIDPETHDISDFQRPTRAPRHLLLIQSLTRDLQESSELCNNALDGSSWVNPFIVVHDRFALQDELVRTLPANIQRDFVKAIENSECKMASSILADSCEGNLDIFNHQTLGATVRSSQLISATFRLFLAVATSINNPTAALETLHGLAQWAYRIHTKYTITKGVLINTHLSLAIATVALKFPSAFACEASRAWVTGTFASCFTCHQAFKSERVETSPLLYWVILMWAGVLRAFGESAGARTALFNLRDDIIAYQVKQPMCHSVERLRQFCLNNLSVRHKDELASAEFRPMQPTSNR